MKNLTWHKPTSALWAFVNNGLILAIMTMCWKIMLYTIWHAPMHHQFYLMNWIYWSNYNRFMVTMIIVYLKFLMLVRINLFVEQSNKQIRKAFRISETISEMWYPKRWLEKSETFRISNMHTYCTASFDIRDSFWNPKQFSDSSFGYPKGFSDMLWFPAFLSSSIDQSWHICLSIYTYIFYIFHKMSLYIQQFK